MANPALIARTATLALLLGGVVWAAPLGKGTILSAMTVIYENVNYGYEGNPNDGCLGPDETLQWMVQGDLFPGQSYAYTYQPNCGPREISAYAGASKGYRADLWVEIRAITDGGEVVAEGLSGACVYWNWSDMTPRPWVVTVTNIDTHPARK